MRVCVLSRSHVRLFATLWTIALQASLPWDFPGKETGVGCHFLLQGIFSTQRSNLHLQCLLHYRQILYRQAAAEALPHAIPVVLFEHHCNKYTWSQVAQW